MGKGDKKTSRGKRFKGSYGNTRKRNSREAVVIPSAKKAPKPAAAEVKEKKAAPKAKPAAKKTAPSKSKTTSKAEKPAAKTKAAEKKDDTKEKEE